MFQILESQSRYELQQQILLNPNGLEINSTNRFGAVDAIGNVSSIKSVSHPNFGEDVTQNTLIRQPKLIVDDFGFGKHSIKANNSSSIISKLNPSYSPEWDVPQYIAFKFKYQLIAGQFRQVIASFGENRLNFWTCQVSVNGLSSGGLLNKIEVFLSTYDNTLMSYRRKVFRTISTLIPGVEYDFIFTNQGINNLSGYEIEINGVNYAYSAALNNSFVGTTRYPGISSRYLSIFNSEGAIGTNEMSVGKCLFGLSVPNKEFIYNSLNSSI